MVRENNHFVKGIPNTKENRKKVKEFNKLARKSNSMHRFRIKYRKPIDRTKKYNDGCMAKDNAQCFSLYLDTTENEKRLRQEYHRKQYEIKSEWRTKYEKLQSKYNAMMLKPLLQELLDNVEELQYASEKGEYWNNIVHSLKGISGGIMEDLNNKLELSND